MTLRDHLLARFPALERLPADCQVVGGAIRDLMSGAEPADVDCVCPDAIEAAKLLGGRVVKLGRGDLVACRVIVDGTIYDLASRVGDSVESDLLRRDFTVDAMAVDLQSAELHDPFGGEADLSSRVLRMVRAENFEDDPLRLIKAVRLAVTLGFTIHPATLDTIRAVAWMVENVAPERVTYEIALTFGCGRFREALRLLRETRLDVAVFGQELDAARYHSDDVTLAGAMALLVSNPDEHAAKWRWSDQLLRQVVAVQELLAMPKDAIRLAVYDSGPEVARHLVSVLRTLGESFEDVPQDEAFFAIRPLLGGEEIAGITGLEPGRELGRIKRQLLEAQLEGSVSSREAAVRFVSEQIA